MPKPMQGRVALVTGGGSGIGRAAARLFALAGARVAIADVRVAAANETAQEIEALGVQSVAIGADVTVEHDVERLVREASSALGPISAAFNCAGWRGESHATADLSLAEWNKTLAICLTGTFLCMKHQIRHMIANNGGAIVNTSSTAGLRAPPAQATAGLPAYVAAKHGVIGLTKAAAVEYAASGVRINVVCPGTTDTPMLRSWFDLEKDEVMEMLAATAPMKRIGQPEEIAQAVVWLCSIEASFATGVVLPIDGGAAA